MLSGVVIEAGLLAFLRVLTLVAPAREAWGALLLGAGMLNIFVGNLLALRQTQVKRLLAYSSLSHMGFMLLGVGIAVAAGTAGGLQGSFLHLLTHALGKGLAFLAVGALLYALRLSWGDHAPLTVSDLSGAARRYPFAAAALTLALLSLGGMPPLSGFLSKWQILAAGIESRNLALGLLVGFAALNSLLSFGYYLPLANALFRRQPSPLVERGRSLPLAMNAPLAILAVALLAAGLWPATALWLTDSAGLALGLAYGP